MDGSFGNQNSKNSALSALAQTITPLFKPMGIEQNNWPATVGIMTGILAKEVVVGTLDSLYSNLDSLYSNMDIPLQNSVGKSAKFEPLTGLKEAFKTIPINLKNALKNILDPLGFGVLKAENAPTVSQDTFGAMVARFDGKIGAFAYLLFILLYFPCVAALGAMAREIGKGWAVIGAFWSTGLAYVVAVMFYQITTFIQHPLYSIFWIIFSIALLIFSIYILMRYGKKSTNTIIPITTLSGCRHCK
jgi:ferrous iron transport protein B